MAVRRTLLAAAIAAGGALPTGVAFAQEAPATKDQGMEEVVVTGSILRRTDAETPSPVTVLSAETLEERGINTVSEAIQRLSANNAGTIQQGWNTGFNFASGANAPALRGLTVQATLSVADGLRIAPYPLADDGQRNFVDLNTIPSAIVERIEVLRDGASSTYGADAIAGVVNVITKKEIQGLHIGGSAARAEQSGGDENRFDITWGVGDLESQGYNFYMSAEYQHQDVLWARDRGYPFNTQDLQQICGENGSCMANLNWNGLTRENDHYGGLVSIPGVALVRHVTTGNNTGTGQYSYLNPSAGCRQFPSYTLTAAELGTSPAPNTICEVNYQGNYIQLSPEIERKGISMRFTANLGENSQFYAMGNWYRTDTNAAFTPLGFNGTLPPPNPATAGAANVILPVYVCSSGVGTNTGLNTGCTAANGVLNPNNPYAAAGERAQILLRSPYGRTVETESRALRGVAGLEGSFGNDWRYAADFTLSEVGLQRNEGNYLIPQRVWDAAAQGTFNFADPTATPKDVWDYIAPMSSEYSVSRLWQMQGNVSKEFLDLPGGSLQGALGVAYREESIDAPSGNPGNPTAPYQRYFSINAVGTAGSRNVKSAFFELNAPVLKQLELNASGRFDDYSTGQSNFSPKFGFKFTPIEQLAFRGTWSEGFRIPSFNESFGLPTTGYVSRTVPCGTYAAWCATHGTPPNGYATSAYNLGLTQVGNPELDPEESTSFTAGIVFEPMSNLSFTIDYWNIEVKNLITGVTDTSAVEQQYYSNGGVVNIPGIVATPGTPDPAFPNALPVLGFIETSYVNQDKENVAGIDFGANLSLQMGDSLTWRSSLDVSWLQKYDLTHDNGTVDHYAGTLSPCNITSCSGAPEYRGSWQNTLQIGESTSVSLTAYYTSGYDTASIDFGGVKGDCLNNAINGASTAAYVATDADGNPLYPVNCKQKGQWNADLTARHTFNDKYTVYLDVLNVFGIDPNFDPSAAYALFNYNPAWGGPNMLGRTFRLGVKLDF